MVTVKKFQLNFIKIRGTSYQRGKQHGFQLKHEINDICAKYQKFAQEAGTDYYKYIQYIMNSTQFYKKAVEYCPTLIEEVKGIADGADQKFEEIFMLQNFEENSWISLLTSLKKSNIDFSLEQGLNCSALGTCQTQNSYPLIGQNADNSLQFVGYETLIHGIDTESDLEWFHITFPGLIGIYGLNNYGIGVCINSISTVHTKSIDNNLGSLFISRGILNCRTLEDAKKFLKKVPHASGLNYLIGDSKNICCVEASPAGVRVIQPTDGSIFHTNHAFKLQDIDHDYLNFLKTKSQITENDIKRLELDTNSRLNTLKTEFEKIKGFKTWSDFKQILSSHTPPEMPVCRHGPPNLAITNTSFVMELTDKPKLRICAGPPCKNQYHEFNFEKKGELI
ncbi:hypothetical protein ES708_13536 [subsurface metagenome]